MFYYEKKKKLKLVTKVSLEIISDRGSIQYWDRLGCELK